MNANDIFRLLDKEAEELYQYIQSGAIPESDSELYRYFEYGQFDPIAWINDNCLEADSHNLLLATGGPAYGVSLVHGSPCYWFQDWFQVKTLRQANDGYAFYLYIFENLKELEEV